MTSIRGIYLHVDDQKHVLRAFVHRYTKTHLPEWTKRPRPDGKRYKPQFADDADWLAHTYFRVKRNGRLDHRAAYCESHPTWPEGSE
jgi:hypothetical protein